MYDWLLFLSLYRQKPNSDEKCLFELIICSLFNLNKNNNDDYTLYFREFVKNAWADIERFKEQKNHDLKEALISCFHWRYEYIQKCRQISFKISFLFGTKYISFLFLKSILFQNVSQFLYLILKEVS